MIDKLKKVAVEKGMSLMSSPMVTKIMESEAAGTVIEKAMTVPFKVSGVITKQKEKLVEMFDLATQEDMDDIRRAMSRVEARLSELKTKSDSADE